MGVEGQHSSKTSFASSGIDHAGNHRLVADVDPIKNTERKMQRYAKRGQVFETFSDQHTAVIVCPRFFFKLYGSVVIRFCQLGFLATAALAAAGFFFRANEPENKQQQRKSHDARRSESLPVELHVRNP